MNSTLVAIPNEIREIIAEIVEVDLEEVQVGKHFVNDLGADSMSALEMMATIEKKYSITIEPEQLPKISTFEQVTDLVMSLLEAKG